MCSMGHSPGRSHVFDGLLCAIDAGDEPITPSGQRFDEARIVRVVGQRLACPADGLVESMLEINESIASPELLF